MNGLDKFSWKTWHQGFSRISTSWPTAPLLRDFMELNNICNYYNAFIEGFWIYFLFWYLNRKCHLREGCIQENCILCITKDCLLTLVKSRHALGSPVWSFVCSSQRRKWLNTWLLTAPSDDIQSETLFQTRQDQERGMIGPASLLHSWHWVLLVLPSHKH